jgi:predicted SPOUT superfamily RNA methylase MTH1
MQADLKLKDLDLVHFEPYVGRYGFSNMESGNLNITSEIKAKKNDLIAQCKLEIDNLKFKPQEAEGSLSLIPQPPTKGVLDFLKGPGEKIVMNFTIRTKLDNPRINFGQLATGVAATAMEKAITSGVSTILQKIEGAPTEGEKPTTSPEEELKKGVEGLKKGLEGIFKLETQ